MKIQNRILRIIIKIIITVISLSILLFILLPFTFHYENHKIYIHSNKETIWFSGMYNHAGSLFSISKYKGFYFSKLFDHYLVADDDLFYRIYKDTLHIYSFGKFVKADEEITKTKIIFHKLNNLEYYNCVEEFQKGKLNMISLCNNDYYFRNESKK